MKKSTLKCAEYLSLLMKEKRIIENDSNRLKVTLCFMEDMDEINNFTKHELKKHSEKE